VKTSLPVLLLVLVASLLFCQGLARGEDSAVALSKEDYQKLLKRIAEMEKEIDRLKNVEKELKQIKDRLDKAQEEAKPADEESPVTVEPPMKFLGLFGEESETVPSLDLSGNISVAFRYSNSLKRGQFTFEGLEIDPRFNLFDELQVGVDLHFTESDPTTDNFYVEQAFIAWAPYGGKVELTLGRFNSIVGIEKPDPVLVFLPSRSIMRQSFDPGDQTGVLAAYALGKFRIFTAITNSFGYNDLGQMISTDNNFDKTYTIRLEYRPSDASALGLNVVAGPEHDGDNRDYRWTVDVDFQHAIQGFFYVGAEAQWGTEEQKTGGNASWWSAQGIFNYTFSRALDASLRVEYANDRDGGARLGEISPSVGPSLYSFAVAVRFHPLTNMNIALEYRRDWGDDSYFAPETYHELVTIQFTVKF